MPNETKPTHSDLLTKTSFCSGATHLQPAAETQIVQIHLEILDPFCENEQAHHGLLIPHKTLVFIVDQFAIWNRQ